MQTLAQNTGLGLLPICSQQVWPRNCPPGSQPGRTPAPRPKRAIVPSVLSDNSRPHTRHFSDIYPIVIFLQRERELPIRSGLSSDSEAAIHKQFKVQSEMGGLMLLTGLSAPPLAFSQMATFSEAAARLVSLASNMWRPALTRTCCSAGSPPSFVQRLPALVKLSDPTMRN